MKSLIFFLEEFSWRSSFGCFKDKIEVPCVLVWYPVSFVDLDIFIADPTSRDRFQPSSSACSATTLTFPGRGGFRGLLIPNQRLVVLKGVVW